ncbi:FAD/NAD(P)-binding domain-containing protein [Cystobasidium minutum MCA 4210]|uniref:FAD/NAD(P)-binding domain-containing protein n=1 Tax=Cystobasidium minutum MCA 4210 TaxID=1397322 RepID=UPI0034CE4EE8|eukprot:jgi/Rhomi1/61113/CE61112_293
MEEAQPTHFDYLVIGTGLRQSLLAAALAKFGHSVLHVDERSYYGEEQATLSLNELVAWADERNHSTSASSSSITRVDLHFTATGSAELPSELAQSARRYNITLCPTIYPSSGPFISSLVRSGVAKYSAFRLIDTVALYDDESLKPAATTKEDIFKDKTLSLIEKRRVMKFVMAANAEEGNEQANDGQLVETLEGKYSLTGRLKEMIMYAAALSVSEQAMTKSAVAHLKKYMRSTGKYGKSPFLLGQYGGIGEIIQGFCRVSAVFGGTYMLGRPIQSLTQPTSEAPGSVKFHENETYTATCAISAEKPDAASPATWQHRGIILLSRRIYLARQATASAEGEGEDANEDTTPVENALFVISPGRLGQDTPSAPVVTMMAGEGSFSAPAGQYVLYMCTVARPGSSATAKECLEPCLKALLQASTEPLKEEDIIMSAFYSQAAEAPLVVAKEGKTQTFPRSADLTTLFGLAEIGDTAVWEATACYAYLTGENELFVQAEEESEDIEDM